MSLNKNNSFIGMTAHAAGIPGAGTLIFVTLWNSWAEPYFLAVVTGALAGNCFSTVAPSYAS